MQIRHNRTRSIILISLGLTITLLIAPLVIFAADLLQNDGLEPPFVKYGEWTGSGHTFDLEVAHGWERFFFPETTFDNGSKLRYFSASAIAFLYGYTEKRDGTDAQLFWSTEPFDGGIYQQISGVTVGEYYGFQAGILQVYGNTTSRTNNKMFRSVGLDPYGGIDPTSSNVIWGPEEGLDVDWFYPGVGAQAQATIMTVFVRVRSTDEAPPLEENSVWVDDTFFDIAPTTSLTLTVDSPTQVTANWSGAPRPGFHLFAYEAQYRRSTESTWTNLQIFDSSTEPVPTATSAIFSIEPGVEYVARARTWHEQDGGDSHEVPGPWVEARVRVGGLIRGNTLDNRGQPFGGVEVASSGDAAKVTTSNSYGAFELDTGPGSFDLTATGSAGWTTPYPLKVTVPDSTATVPVTITLSPPDNVIQNGDFEDGLNGWAISGVTAATTAVDFYSGAAGLQLSNTVIVSQTAQIVAGYQPGLSFWYKMVTGGGTFTAEILGADGLNAANIFSISEAGEWQHVWLPLGVSGDYTGPVTVRFTLSGEPDSLVYLDGVTLGSSRQSYYVHLPMVVK